MFNPITSAHINSSEKAGKKSSAYLMNSLDFLWLEITEKCNLTCAHCYANSSSTQPLLGKLILDGWLRVISQASHLGCRSLQFIGGEPTLHPDLDIMIEHASNQGFEFIEIFTNATGLSSSRLNNLVRFNVNVACSFYSAQPRVHDMITQRDGSFHKTVNTIKRLVEAGISLRAGIIEMNHNSGQLDVTSDFLRSIGVKIIGADRVRSVGRGERLANRSNSDIQDICGQCWKGKLCITPDGDAYPCIMARNSLVGNVLHQSLSDILYSNHLIAFRQKVKQQFENKALESDPCHPDKCNPDLQCWPDKQPCFPDKGCWPDNCNPDKHN